MDFDWQAVLILFVLRAAEIGSLCYFLSPLNKRKNWPLFSPVVALGFSVLLVVIHELISLGSWESEFVYISFAYYPTFFAFIMVYYDLSVKEGGYFLLLYFLSIHALRILVIRAADLFLGISFLSEGTSFIQNLFVVLVILLLLCLVFILLKKFVFRYPNHRLTLATDGFLFSSHNPCYLYDQSVSDSRCWYFGITFFSVGYWLNLQHLRNRHRDRV